MTDTDGDTRRRRRPRIALTGPRRAPGAREAPGAGPSITDATPVGRETPAGRDPAAPRAVPQTWEASGPRQTQEAPTTVLADNVVEFPETHDQARRRRRRVGWMGAAAVLVVLAVLGAVLYFSPLLAIRTVAVTGTDLLPQQRAEELLAPVHGVPLPQVGQRTVDELLAGESVVAEVHVRAEPPSALAVEVVEHQPVAMVPDGGERTLYSAAGQPLATLPAREAESYRLPIVESVDDVRDPAVFDVITSVLGTLPESVRAQLESASARSVDSVTLRLTDGRTVLWGNADQGDRKARVLEALLKVPEDETVPVQEFDVSTPHRPVTR